MKNFFNHHWWQNRLKYLPLFQRAFLFFNLSSKFPRALNIEATNACNFDCSFCPVKSSGRKKGFMDWRLYKKIIDEIVREGGVKVLWLMKDGEPLMHPKIDKMIAYAQKRKAAQRIEIYTNGFFLTETMGRKLIKAGLDVLNVSLDAIDKKSFAKIKGINGYHQVTTNLKNFIVLKKGLKAKKPLVVAKMVDLGEKNQIRKFKQIWQGQTDSVIIQPLHNWEGSGGLTRNIRKDIKRYPCNLVWLNPAIYWDGKVVPCCVNYQENELVLGDIKKQSLRKIFQGEKYQALRQAHLNQEFSKFPTCAGCQYWQQLPDMAWWLRRLNG